MPTGAELFIRSLRELEIDTIFTLVGDHLNEALLEAARAGMRIVDMRHESGVTHAADGYARWTRKPAVSLVTGGPGHTNSLTGIATANAACSPLIAVSGSRATAVAGRGAFQDLDQLDGVRGMVKWAGEPRTVAAIPSFVGRAYAEASSGRMGAVHLTIPVDLFTGKTDAPLATPLPSRGDAAAPDVTAALELLHGAERPLVIAGSGVWWDDAAAELRAFIEASSLPLYTITMARGAVSDEHPLVFGYGDPALNEAVRTSFREADVVLVVGKRIDYRLAFGGARLFDAATKFVQIDVHGPELGANRALACGVQGSVRAALRAMSGVKWPPRREWLGRLSELRDAWSAKLAEASADCGELLHPAAFFAEWRKHLPPNPIYCWDGGDFVHWGRAIVPATEPGRWLRLGPMGTIGSGLPISVAVKFAARDQPVLMITGDGSLGFYLAEIDTMVRHGLPVVIVVGNDGGWGIERELQRASGESVAVELRRTAYDRVTEALGGAGETVERVEQVGPAMRRALASGVPYCLNVAIRGVRSPFTAWQIAGKK